MSVQRASWEQLFITTAAIIAISQGVLYAMRLTHACCVSQEVPFIKIIVFFVQFKTVNSAIRPIYVLHAYQALLSLAIIAILAVFRDVLYVVARIFAHHAS